jgi:hypothetical protein
VAVLLRELDAVVDWSRPLRGQVNRRPFGISQAQPGPCSDVSSAGGGVALASTRGSRASAASGDMSGGSGNGGQGW